MAVGAASAAMTTPGLRRTAFAAARWTSVSACIVGLVQIVQVAVLARLLAPSDFGLMAVVGAVTSLAFIFADVGLGKALVYFEAPPRETLSSLYWTNLLSATLLAVIIMIAASLFAPVSRHGVAELVVLAVFALPIAAIGQQFRAMAEKEMRFFELATNEIVASAVGFGIAVVLAWAGTGVRSLVFGMLSSVAANSFLSWLRLSKGLRPMLRWHAAEVLPYVRFGMASAGDALVTGFNRQSDVLIGGVFASPQALGFYSVPRDLSMKVSLVVNPIASRVGFPLMAMVRHDRPRLSHIYATGLSLTCAVNFPIYFALCAFAPDVIGLLFGASWASSAPYLRILAAWGMLRSISNPIGSLLYAVGKPRLALAWNLVALATFVPVLWLFARTWGLPGLAWAMLLLQVAIIMPGWWWLIRPFTGLAFGAYVGGFSRPFLASAFAAGAGLVASSTLPAGSVRLAVSLVAFLFAYLLLSWFVNRSVFRAARELFRGAPDGSA